SALMLLFILAMDFKEINPGVQKTERREPDAAGLNRIFEVKAVPHLVLHVPVCFWICRGHVLLSPVFR
ncbi:MAG: hypothetical protein LUE23_00300, partial [Lachnospiraceae bacterium]|nr:hypothetical protein [Lachnospiraceae bacterium]